MVNHRGGRDAAATAMAAMAVVAVATFAVSTSATGAAGRRGPDVAPTTVPTTAAATAATTTAPLSTDASTTTVTLPTPASESADPVRTLVPLIAVVPAVLTDDADRQAAIDVALSGGGNTVAVEDGPGTLCAIVVVPAPVTAAGRWERNGEPIGTSTEQRRDPPGFGDCLTNPDGEAFEEAVYQYVAIGPTGATSAAASVVVGVEPVEVWLVNNNDEPVCLVQMSPSRADYYEGHDTDSPLLPGEAIAISAAEVEHDVQVFGCPPDNALRTFQFTPEPQSYVDMFDDDSGTATTTTRPGASAAPTTT